ncbi:hypothetical protein ARMGADRAFT_73393 [Armillaria gallica]|uniref:Uncharacterized protein n=1 Tax=Armillaria gallica TaxID=47427 RepID=A0A2H3DLL8_ARMGA|nr:hypothetical protein ARMGADRAFT_73393 [Armillaria gallica]
MVHYYFRLTSNSFFDYCLKRCSRGIILRSCPHILAFWTPFFTYLWWKGWGCGERVRTTASTSSSGPRMPGGTKWHHYRIRSATNRPFRDYRAAWQLTIR